MKIKYSILLWVFMALVACQREEDITIATLTYSNETITPLYYTADISCVLNCNAPFKDVYVQYSTHVDFADYQVRQMTPGKKGSYSITLSDLEPNVTYYVRYEISNNLSTLCSKEHSEFRTMALSAPVLSTVLDSTSITCNSAVIGGKIISNGGLNITERGIVFGVGENPTIDHGLVMCEQDSFVCELQNLEVVTTYYVRAYAKNSLGVAYGESVRFETLSTIATMDTIAVSAITANTATISAGVLVDGGSTITTRGICYAESMMPSIENSIVICEGGIGAFTCNLTDLNRATTYYVRAYATNSNGTVYSEEISFTTDKTIPVVTTEVARSITALSAIVGGKINDNGGANVTECGVVYSTSQNPTTADNKVKPERLRDEFTCELVDLQVVTTYYARAYAINEKGIAYGEEISFTTLSTSATLSKPSASSITVNTAIISAEVLTDGGASITDRGVVYSTSKSPTVSNSKVTNQGGIGAFTCNLTDLNRATTYYVRAYATNSNGTVYSEEISFTTDAILPTLTTTEATKIFNTSAIVGGNITDDGGANITERGVVYSTLQNPTTLHNKVNNGIGSGTYTCSLTGLQAGTLYYTRAYAINEKGIVYGNEVSFTTMATVNLPITTTPATDVTCTTAEVGGNITEDGGSAITERGVCYGTSPSPTMSDMTIQKGRGVGIFSCTLTELQDGVTYYVRAYGVNTLGISYGDEISFTTPNKSLPTIAISQPTKYSVDDATIKAELVDDGCLEITTRGVVYSTSPTPSIDDMKVVNSGGVGNYSCYLSNLQEATTYYVRAYAENEKGIAYSDVVSFTTRTRTYHDGYEYVDMGLSVMWATHNVGCTSPEEKGNYYAWGEVEPKTTYSWSTYDYCNGTETSMTKYCTNSSYGIVDNKKYLEPIDDAAHANWGGDWRMPTGDEMQELMNQCTWELTSYNGRGWGYKVTSRINGNTIFMPSNTGYKDGTGTTYSNFGYFYSSSLSSSSSSYYIDCGSSNTNIHLYSASRYYGRTVRPVWREMELPTVTTGSLSIVSDFVRINKNNVTNTGGAPVTECGIVYCTLPNPTISDTKVPIGSGLGEFTATLTELQEGLTYYVRAYATNQKGTAYGEELSFRYVKPYENGYEYVDLGLSSGLKWATMNVGASSPEDYGNYYAWGETTTKDTYNWSTYKYCNGSASTLTKYCTNSSYGNNGFTDNKTTLELSDDAAAMNWGGSWRMPTDAEWTELRTECTWTWTTQNGVKGRLVTGPNGNSIFLPATGYRGDSSLDNAGSGGYYWSSSLDASVPKYTCSVYFLSGGVYRNSGDRCYGRSVRPVCQ